MKRILVCSASLALASLTLGQTYAKRTVTINAAVALIESDQTGGVPSNFTPHVWFNLDNNTRIKPAGYDFVNPNKESQFTAAITNRWNILAPGTSPAPGTFTNKRHAPYWELRLSTATDEQLGRLDVLLLAPKGFVSLNPGEREKLRRFVEKGGVLWVDVASSTTFDPYNGLPFPFTTTGVVAGPGPYNDYLHPLLSYPTALGDGDLLAMQSDFNVSQAPNSLALAGYPALDSIAEPLQIDTYRFTPAAVDNKGPFISSAQVGDGFIVVTTKSVSTTLNRLPSSGGYVPNNGAVAGSTASDRAADSASKLAINIVSLNSGYASTLRGPRKAGSSGPADMGAPMLQRFSDQSVNMTPGSPNGYRPATVFKGLLIATTDSQVIVYDVDPKRDIDGDGDPDDGIRDFARGAPYDVIWTSQGLSGPLSSAVGIEVPNAATGLPADQIVVTDSAGAIHAYEAFPYSPAGVLQGLTNATPAYSISPDTGVADYDFGQMDGGPYAPVFHEGYLVMADSQNNGLSRSGRVWLANPATGRQVTSNGTGWSVGGSAAASAIGDTSFSPTVGYIPIADNSGGVDKVIYVPFRPNPAGGPQSTAGLASVWLGSKGERPSNVIDQPGTLEVQTRASSQGLTVYKPSAATDDLGLGVRLTILKPNGDPYSPLEMDQTFTGAYTESNGRLIFVKKGAAPAFPVGFGVRVDYTIDYGTGVPGLSALTVRGTVNFPDDSDRLRRIVHGVALSPKGTIHLVMSSQDPATKAGGSYYALREEGRGNFRVMNRFDLYPQHVITTNQANDVSYPETLQNTDQILNYAPGILGGRMDQQTFMSGPVISNGVAYVTGQGNKNLIFARVPFTFTMAFRAEPEVLRVEVGNLANGFSVLQPDMARSAIAPGGRPDSFSVLQPNQYTYEDERGDAGTLRIDNLSATTRGPLTNVLSTSQPIILRRNNQDDLLLEPSRNGNWNQMLWYMVWLGTDSRAPMFASGRTLYMAGQSDWASILVGAGTFTPIGQVFAMDTEIAPNDKFLASSDPNRPWFKQLYQLRGTGGFANIDVNPAVKWPLVQGITSFDEYRVRLTQTLLKIPGGTFATRAHGVIGGNGTVVAWANEGLWAYRSGDFVVADEGRVMRFDQVGSPVWSIAGTTRSGPAGDTGTAAEVTPLVRPTRAYAAGDRAVMIVDTGANKVMKTDISGREIRTISGFRVDPNFKPAGYSTLESTQLNLPRDVITFTNVVAAASNPFSNAQPQEYWVHYVIADSGNNRLIELVDRYQYQNNRVGAVVNDSTGANGLSVLYWHSPTAVSGAGYSYTSLARTFVDDGPNSRWVYAAGIGNLLPTRADIGAETPATSTQRKADEGNGGIVIIDGANTQVINQVQVPGVGPNVYWNDTTASFNSPALAARVKKLSNLNSVTMRTRVTGGNSQIVIMFTDAEGVFEIGDTGGGNWAVEWMLDRYAYSAMRRFGTTLTTTDNPLDFRATYARRLESGDVLVCNGYTGFYRRVNATDPRVRFTGEVALIDGDFDPAGTGYGFDWNKTNLGFDTISIRALLNNKPGGARDARGIVGPVFADRQ